MVRFSCFHSPTDSDKPKKTVEMPTEAVEDYSESQPKNDETIINGNHATGQDSKSEGFESIKGVESDVESHNISQLKKSMSFETGLVDYKGKSTDFSFEHPHENSGDSSNRSSQSQQDMVKSRSFEDVKALDTSRKDVELGKGKNVKVDDPDFKIKRIEKWVMDLKHCSLDETDQLTDYNLSGQNDNDPASRIDAKAVLGMDLGKNCISSLSPSATAVNLANRGLVTMPILSSFSSLKVLDLSGNAIVWITAGALPKGLHILNLSKNSISTIEGLRELTRLRVLDLSYNRILRIGHGLASCSSLKELYLAGNKISEVEGLHRLLKLNVLDLRFNKLSTTKNLGQLAANYNSLQAISLEGNPAHKNIGDEHLKKYLVGLLPHLAYFNRQSIKSGAMKDSADRAARLGISAHPIDRKLRSELKSKSKSTRGPKSPPVARHARFLDTGSKVESSKRDLAIRKSRSEGLLGGV